MEDLPDGWIKVFSKTHQKDYYFESATGKTQWMAPSQAEGAAPPPSKKQLEGSSSSSDDRSAEAKGKLVQKTAIIVPFRDLHAEQKRKQHLQVFIPAMTEYLISTKCAFKIFIIEQSDDGRKFNRGKLLNIGYTYAEAQQCTNFIFHDVDLIPSAELKPWYTSIPQHPAHIARVWNRYSDNPKYFGGVVSFSRDQYRSINGFPNNFWGWGGEDDEMYRRVKRQNMNPIHPTSGSLQDLEEMTLQSKLQFLKKNPTWKCMNKNEMLEEGDEWKTNGLSSLRFTELSRTSRNDNCDVIQVDIMENNHWSDLVCKNDDMQYDTTVEELKAQFAAAKKKKKEDKDTTSGGADTLKKRKHSDR